MDKALIAMSGGVDSSVSAALMKKAGYECIGVTMKLHGEDGEPCGERSCCTASDAEDARNVCFKLGMKYYVFNFTGDFEKEVIDRFISAYENGCTPNPCIDCNRYMKFERLFRRGQELGCDYIVTGHYARVEFDEERGRWLLKKSLNSAKDQSYVLYSLTQEQLAHIKFPLGEFTDKEQVRALAVELDLVNADKKDSQDICFVPDGDYAAFIERHTGKTYPEGNFVGLDGTVYGKHKGIIGYTIGQRKGLGLSFPQPMYVVAKNLSENTVTLAPENELYRTTLRARDFNWISLEKPPKEPVRVTARTRYHAKEAAASVWAEGDGTVVVRFDEPQRAIASGQAVVLYDGEIVVGGGTIV
ncbi:MAG: tRNA 2-thiouridine(34) synthase MnmA [Oscillospiraceae bacterium]|nr:tRNA 2-thiouridine(34) synthase MnmA [Oscillospiraceae bacterium]